MIQEISNRTVPERTPKPEYLIARSQLPERGPLGFGPIEFLMNRRVLIIDPNKLNSRHPFRSFAERKAMTFAFLVCGGFGVPNAIMGGGHRW